MLSNFRKRNTLIVLPQASLVCPSVQRSFEAEHELWSIVNLLKPELFFLILAHPVYKI